MEMNLCELNYNNEKLDVSINCYINKKNEIWFRGKEIALVLGYKNTTRAIRKHVDKDDKILIDFKICSKSTRTNLVSVAETSEKTRKCVFINESGFYSLVMSSKLVIAKKFKRWVTNEILPSIRKRGYYESKRRNHIIETENDLHCAVVSFIRDKYPETLMIAGLGENQTTDAKRIESWTKGYMSGQCDLMLLNPTRKYSALCIEFKDPRGFNSLSQKQVVMKESYERNKCRYLMSRSLSDICFEIIRYLDESKKYLKRRSSRKP